MPRPKSPLTIVHSPGKKFPYDGWEGDLRTYKYFRVSGFGHFARLGKLFDHSLFENTKLVDRAKGIVESEWGAFLPPSHSNKDGINRVGKGQIERVRKGQPVSFQSACVALVTLELALADNAIDIYSHRPESNDPYSVWICPALFLIDNYGSVFYEKQVASVPETFLRLTMSTKQTRHIGRALDGDVFQRTAVKGELITEELAKRTIKTLEPHLASYRACNPRAGSKFNKVNSLEIDIFPRMP